jgi:diamine N-acetyltransferase
MISSAIRVHRAGLDDVEAISALATATFRLGCPPETKPADIAAFAAAELTPQRFREHLANPDATLLIAETAGQIAGYVMLVRNSRHPLIKAEPVLEVRKVYVSPDHHGAGVAHALMESAADSFASAAAVWLSVYSGNARAIAFYKKCGFEIVGTHHFLVGTDPQKDFVMQRLPQAGTK